MGGDAEPSASDDGDFRVPYLEASLPTGRFLVPAFAAHRPASRAVLAGRLHEPATHALVASLLAAFPGSLVHAGAFFGDMLPTFSRACPSMVYAFEPVLEHYVLARLCVEENSLANVILANAALGSSCGTLRMDTVDAAGRHRGGGSFVSDHGRPVSAIRLDCLVMSDLAVIQLDVEGHEAAVLEGARRSVHEHQPVILVEDNGGQCAPLLRAWGYRPAGHVPGLRAWSPESRHRMTVDLVREAAAGGR